MFSGALRPSIILGFLTLNLDVWNPTLLILILTVTIFNMILFMLTEGRPQPYYDESIYHLLGNEGYVDSTLVEPQIAEKAFSSRLILGSVVFGSGWGLAGLCPGTVVSGGFFVYSHALIWFIGYLVGRTVGIWFYSRVQTKKSQISFDPEARRDVEEASALLLPQGSSQFQEQRTQELRNLQQQRPVPPPQTYEYTPDLPTTNLRP